MGAMMVFETIKTFIFLRNTVRMLYNNELLHFQNIYKSI